jgi:glutamyl-tRNA reductase
MLPAGTTPWVVDLSTPSAVERALAERLGENLLSLDELGERHGSAPVLEPEVEARLRRRLGDEVTAFAAWLDARHGADALALLHRSADDVRRRHLDRLRRKAFLDETQLAAVEAASAAMFGELLHGPTLELRHGGADADTVRRLFRIDS